MSNIIELQKFIDRLRTNLKEIDKAENICLEVKRSPNAFVKVLATSVLHIFKEAQAYLDYYGEDVEKSIDGASVADEQMRVWDSIFAPFQAKLAAMSTDYADNQQLTAEVVCTVGELIDSWDHFPKEDLDQVLFSERTQDKS